MKVITIGRSPDNDVVINDPLVGRHHAKIIQHNDGHYTISDLSSKNGTFVNGKRVFGEVWLSPNDVVQVGRTAFPWISYFSLYVPPTLSSQSSSNQVLKTLPVIFVLIALGIVFIVVAVFLFVGRSTQYSQPLPYYEETYPQQDYSNMTEGKLQSSNKSIIQQKISVRDIADDLIGQVISAPSDDGYFPKEWRWEIEDGEVLDVKELNREKDQSGYEVITIFAHLHKGSVKIDAEMILKYSQNGGRRVLTHSRTTKLIIPRQTDYSQCVELKMDYDFMPSLMLHNHSNMTLFVGGDYSSGDQRVLFGTIVKPLSSEMVAVGSIQNYHVHFAYEK